MIKTTVQRIKQYIDFKGLSVREFEVSVGFSNGSFASQFKNNKTIGVDKVENILHKYTDLNSEWLLTGKGEMLKSNNLPIAIKTENYKEGIPLIPIEAMAGFGNGETQVMEFEGEYFTIPTFRGAEFLILVKGSSMYPKYGSGDIVACKKLPLNDLFFQWNKVYVLDTIQGALIKRIKQGSDTDHILIVSDNESYEPFELHKTQIHSVALVMGVIRLE